MCMAISRGLLQEKPESVGKKNCQGILFLVSPCGFGSIQPATHRAQDQRQPSATTTFCRSLFNLKTGVALPRCNGDDRRHQWTMHAGVLGILPSTGGTGKYWVVTWTSVAVLSLKSRAMRCSASSRPEDMPPPVSRLPDSTKRGWPLATLIAGKRRRQSTNAQCVVALWPSSSPARASSSAPSQTEQTHFALTATCCR